MQEQLKSKQKTPEGGPTSPGEEKGIQPEREIPRPWERMGREEERRLIEKYTPQG